MKELRVYINTIPLKASLQEKNQQESLLKKENHEKAIVNDRDFNDNSYINI